MAVDTDGTQVTALAPFADAGEIAGMLSAISGSEVIPIDGGFRVKETDDCLGRRPEACSSTGGSRPRRRTDPDGPMSGIGATRGRAF